MSCCTAPTVNGLRNRANEPVQARSMSRASEEAGSASTRMVASTCPAALLGSSYRRSYKRRRELAECLLTVRRGAFVDRKNVGERR